jgi:peroxiredoxin
MPRPEAAAALALIRREYELCCRSPLFYAMAAVGCGLAVWRASAPGTTSALAAYQSVQLITVGLGLIAILLAGSAGAWLCALTAAALMLVAASAAQIALGRTAWHPQTYMGALARCALPLGLASALGFSLASIFTTPLAAAVAAVYWIAIPITQPYMPMVLDWTLGQHWVLTGALLGLCAALAIALYARPMRAERRAGRLAGYAAVGFLVVALAAVLAVTSSGEDALTGPDPILEAMATQSVSSEGRAPGLWLPDARGRLGKLSDFSGRPIALLFWGPETPSSTRALASLEEAAKEFRDAGVSCIAVCVDRDARTVAPFAREVPDVVMLWDRGRHFGDGLMWSDSPAAIAYGMTGLPTCIVLDRDRRVVATLVDESGMSGLRDVLSQVAAK